MSKEFILPPALERGDKVAIVSAGNGPSKDIFPEVYDLGIKRLKEKFDLTPVEYSTVGMDSEELTDKPELRAEQIMDAFKDDEIKGVIAPIGGTGEQVRILKHLDPEVLQNNPTRFYGYSDNTSLNLYLWQHGLISFQGPMVMTELAMNGEMHDYAVDHVEKAFFSDEIGEVEPSEKFTDENLDWGKPENLEKYREMEENLGWEWYNFSEPVSGRTWGGCLEVISINMSANRIPGKEELEGNILVFETSEELPDTIQIEDFMLGLGERGILEVVDGVIVGRAKARSHREERSKEEREEYRENQKQVIKKWMKKYASDTPVLFNFDFGHTDPIVPLPVGGKATIDPEEKRIKFE
jgi:muramoyltetrapeptide carboxypeptidase LdcA involved in peptidoglycan recycling